MFDPRTRELIQGVPAIGEIVPEKLPEYLARAFDRIVEFRVARNSSHFSDPEKLRETSSFLRSLANSLESLVVLRPEAESRKSSAFVAAQARRLLSSYENAASGNQGERIFLHIDFINSEISGMLLFLIAEQQSDALDVARDVEDQYLRDDARIKPALTQALVNLVKGELEATAYAFIPEVKETLFLEARAAETLYRMIFESVVDMASGALVYSEKKERFGFARKRLERVKGLAVSTEPLQEYELWLNENHPNISDFLKQTAFSSFAGPAHLASLLLPCVDFVEEAALAYVMPPSGSNSQNWSYGLSEISKSRPYLWSNHREAIATGFLNNGSSTTCSFPTGAGKSTLSELRILSTLTAGKSVIFIAPTNALVSQTQKALAKAFPHFEVERSVIAEDAYAEIEERNVNVGVMTPERCLMIARLTPERFKDVGLIVFDECHLMHGSDGDTSRRGLDAMLAILYLFTICGQADWLLLSAMMSNADELAEWIEDITKRPCHALTLEWKPTRQARGCLVYNGHTLDKASSEVQAGKEEEHEFRPKAFVSLLQTWGKANTGTYSAISLSDEKVSVLLKRTPWGEMRCQHKKNEIAPQIAAGFAKAGMKVLIFAHSKVDVGAIAARAGKRLKETKKAVKNLTATEERLMGTIESEVGCLSCSFIEFDARAGQHHSLLLASEREFVEARFQNPDGFQVLAATATLAQGMNLPADAVIIVGSERFDVKSKKQQDIAAHDLLNAAGRAGRAGHVSQGFVLFIPQKVVGLNLKEKRIDSEWNRIRTSIFEFSDQCLVIGDPVQTLLDEIQAGGVLSSEAAYFLRRLPSFNDKVDTAPEFLTRSYSAFCARKKGEQDGYKTKVRAALELREAALRDPDEFTWHAEVATRNGVPIAIIQDLANFLEDIDITADCTVLAGDIFGWLFATPERTIPVFSERLVQRYGAEMQGDLFGPKILDGIVSWMGGANLKTIQALRTGNKEKHLNSARKFVLQAIPELSFGIGLAAQTYRAGIDNGVFHNMPINLAMVSQCVRDGLPTPEVLALSFLLEKEKLPRADILDQWAEISNAVKPRDLYEEFSATIRRVKKGLSNVE